MQCIVSLIGALKSRMVGHLRSEVGVGVGENIVEKEHSLLVMIMISNEKLVVVDEVVDLVVSRQSDVLEHVNICFVQLRGERLEALSILSSKRKGLDVSF
jgi:hypothetical protein